MTSPRPPAWLCHSCGVELPGGCQRLSSRCRVDAEFVVHRLEEAGRTLLALPGKGCWPAGFGNGWPAVVHDAASAYGYGSVGVRIPKPTPAAIDRMDLAWRWLALIPDGKRVLRRIVVARSMVSPSKDRHLHGWRELGRTVGADHKAVQRWHGQGIGLIVAALVRCPNK